ncbi:MAG TPA: prephenate dehydratase domain-containing protein, partial [Longimicrobiales bacterium]|nr:prephenate dehydratase domain-containing protein [Longimicrobiales bacterium]
VIMPAPSTWQAARGGAVSPDARVPQVRVAFQGAPGAFSEEAALAHFGAGVECVPCATFADAGALLANGAATHGIFPLENAIAGPVHASLDVLARYGFGEVARVSHPIRMFLLAIPGATLAEIRQVISHPVALEQCGAFLRRLSNACATPFFDTAGAAREVASRGIPTLAAISPPATAARYCLRVLASDVHDRPDNVTHFAVVRA